MTGASAKPVRIALLGCGTIGTGVVKLLKQNSEMLARRLGRPLELAAVADRKLSERNLLGVPPAIIVRNPALLVTRPDIDIVVELLGGVEPARSLTVKALEAGKDVVTANKLVLAEHGEQVFRVAEKSGVGLGFEAAVAGGVPIIRTLRDALAGDRQRAVYGIVNGTCNSILTTMSENELDFDVALDHAREQGLAEADPSLDIEGHDAAHKLCLLVSLAFGSLVKPSQVYTEGITRIARADLRYAADLGYTVKLMAIAKDDSGAIEARVHPTMVPTRHVLASVGGAYNAIYIHGEALGDTMYVGLGAGQMPTATAVVADIVDRARERIGTNGGRSRPLGYPVNPVKRARVKPMSDVICEYYLRFMAEDRPGALGRIASVLGRNRISLASVIQQGRGVENRVPVIMRTHEARERDLMRALRQIARLRIVEEAPALIRIEERL